MRRVLPFLVVLAAAAAVAAAEPRFDVPVGDSPALGPKDAPVTLIEFVDYQ